jgi:dTDP-4-dehydrorhamnose 3,5-epimerase
MRFTPTSIPEVLLIESNVLGDDRGFFMETYQAARFRDTGIDEEFVQDNHSGSVQGTLRGLHYQIRQSQGKLVRVVTGEVFDVAVDLRRSSPTFGNWVGKRLSSDNKLQMWIPPGFAHGFYVLSEWADMIYKVTDFYAPEWDRTLLWNDPKIGIDWPLIEGVPLLLSKKDAQGAPLNKAEFYE